MKIKRYYSEAELNAGSTIKLEGEEYHHLKDVMRSRVGDKIVLFDGSGYDADAEVLELNKNFGLIKVNSLKENESEPKIKVTLFQAVCKGEKLSLITQKITELGASELCVFYSTYTDIKDKTSKLDKLGKVSISACKQCGRSKPLEIVGVLDFDTMLERSKSLDKVFIAYENADQTSLFESLSKNANYKSIGIIVGAEGGFSEKEIEKVKNAGIEIVTLGKRILRTETASIASIAQILFAVEK